MKLLGINIDNELKFDKHVNEICLKANQKLSILNRMKSFLNLKKRRSIFKAFIESQFKYCPLIWFFHSRKSSQKVNRLHERALRIVYDDFDSTFEQLLEQDNSFSIHTQSIHRLCIEIFKNLNKLPSGDYISDFINLKHEDTLELDIPSVNSELKGKCSLRYFGPVIWNSLPVDLRKSESLAMFQAKIKSLKFDNCPCRNCKTFVSGVGFCCVSG